MPREQQVDCGRVQRGTHTGAPLSPQLRSHLPLAHPLPRDCKSVFGPLEQGRGHISSQDHSEQMLASSAGVDLRLEWQPDGKLNHAVIQEQTSAFKGMGHAHGVHVAQKIIGQPCVEHEILYAAQPIGGAHLCIRPNDPQRRRLDDSSVERPDQTGFSAIEGGLGAPKRNIPAGSRSYVTATPRSDRKVS
jgi:hypothetical protein